MSSMSAGTWLQSNHVAPAFTNLQWFHVAVDNLDLCQNNLTGMLPTSWGNLAQVSNQVWENACWAMAWSNPWYVHEELNLWLLKLVARTNGCMMYTKGSYRLKPLYALPQPGCQRLNLGSSAIACFFSEFVRDGEVRHYKQTHTLRNCNADEALCCKRQQLHWPTSRDMEQPNSGKHTTDWHPVLHPCPEGIQECIGGFLTAIGSSWWFSRCRDEQRS